MNIFNINVSGLFYYSALIFAVLYFINRNKIHEYLQNRRKDKDKDNDKDNNKDK